MNLDTVRKRIRDDFETLLNEMRTAENSGYAVGAPLINVISGVLKRSEREFILTMMENNMNRYKSEMSLPGQKDIATYYYSLSELIYSIIKIAFDLNYNRGCKSEEDIIILNRIYFLLSYLAFETPC